MENKQKLEIRAVVSKTCAQGPGDLLLCSSYFQSSLVTKNIPVGHLSHYLMFFGEIHQIGHIARFSLRLQQFLSLFKTPLSMG
ncbi:Junction Plakoglobin [Manis pentadactyla]|nr:Junction Plakoglobin [Manis pentadactyla]